VSADLALSAALSSVAAVSIFADAVTPAEWAPLVGSLSAAGAVIYTVRVFLSQQEKAEAAANDRQTQMAAEFSKSLTMLVEANREANSRFADEIAAVAKELNSVGHGVATIVDRNDRKDGSA